MTLFALEVLDAVRRRLDDLGGDTGSPPVGYYATWQANDAGCLWKNTELVAFLNQTLRDWGQRAPSRVALGITLVKDTRHYALDPDIVRIESITRASDGQSLLKASVGEMQSVARWNRLQRETLAVDWRTETGWPTHYVLDEIDGSLTVYPMPSATEADSLRLVVWQGPFAAYLWDDLDGESEPSTEVIGVEDDEPLIAGICARAYRKRDADGEDLKRAQQWDQEFTAAIGPPLSLRQLQSEWAWADRALDPEPRTYFAR